MEIGNLIKVTDPESLKIRRENGNITAGIVTGFDMIDDVEIVYFKSCGVYDFANVATVKVVPQSAMRWRSKT